MRNPLALRSSKNPFNSWFFDSDFDRIFNDLVPREEIQKFSPAVDIEEDEKKYVLSFDLPGLKKEEIKIDLQEGTLVVSGERKHEKKEEKGKIYHLERSRGFFQRSFQLPEAILTDQVEALYEEGVLKIVLPKKEGTQPRQIPVK